eukprot:2056508-Amphidinium_carterae.1
MFRNSVRESTLVCFLLSFWGALKNHPSTPAPAQENPIDPTKQRSSKHQVRGSFQCAQGAKGFK